MLSSIWISVLLCVSLGVLSQQPARVTDVSVDTQDLPYNKSLGWAEFFRRFSRTWGDVTRNLDQVAMTDLENNYQTVLTQFRNGFADRAPPIGSSQLPGSEGFQSETRRALLYMGLPGYMNSSSLSNDQKTQQHVLQRVFPIFVSSTGSTIGSDPNDPIWPISPNVCISRWIERVSSEQVNPIMNVTYCTCTKGEQNMQCVCWLPVLAFDGSATRGERFVTVYQCCPGFSLTPLPTIMPPSSPVRELLNLLDRPRTPDRRVCAP